jgi:hypothetical protein
MSRFEGPLDRAVRRVPLPLKRVSYVSRIDSPESQPSARCGRSLISVERIQRPKRGDLDRECMRAALKHGDDKRALDMGERDVRRA